MLITPTLGLEAEPRNRGLPITGSQSPGPIPNKQKKGLIIKVTSLIALVPFENGKRKNYTTNTFTLTIFFLEHFWFYESFCTTILFLKFCLWNFISYRSQTAAVLSDL